MPIECLAYYYYIFTCSSEVTRAWSTASKSNTKSCTQELRNWIRNNIRLRLLSWSSGGRLFHAAGQATANARGSMVTVFVAGMNRSPDAAERMCEHPEIEPSWLEYSTSIGRKEPILFAPSCVLATVEPRTLSMATWNASGARSNANYSPARMLTINTTLPDVLPLFLWHSLLLHIFASPHL